MVRPCRPLIEVLAEIPDVRKARGKRHPLPAILALVSVAMVCGYRSYGAAAQGARIDPAELVQALGFRHPTPPCAATLHPVLRRVDRVAFEAKRGAWAAEVRASLPPDPSDDEGVALDGKELRGSRRQGARNVHLLSALSHRLGLTLGQQAVDDKTNEITVAVPLRRGLLVEGRIFTRDARLTQRPIAPAIIAGKGDYVMVVKGTQPARRHAIELVFAEPPEDDDQPSVETVERGHGRIASRRLTARSARVGSSDWPGLPQVFRLDRTTILRKTGEVRAETVDGVTSLDHAHATVERLLRLTRPHGRIENRSPWVRDVTFDEDRSQVRRGSTPEVMAALRNTTLGLLRAAGETNIAAACRRFAAQPATALTLVGLTVDWLHKVKIVLCRSLSEELKQWGRKLDRAPPSYYPLSPRGAFRSGRETGVESD